MGWFSKISKHLVGPVYTRITRVGHSSVGCYESTQGPGVHLKVIGIFPSQRRGRLFNKEFLLIREERKERVILSAQLDRASLISLALCPILSNCYIVICQQSCRHLPTDWVHQQGDDRCLARDRRTAITRPHSKSSNTRLLTSRLTPRCFNRALGREGGAPGSPGGIQQLHKDQGRR